jgi:hypothetical protein
MIFFVSRFSLQPLIRFSKKDHGSIVPVLGYRKMVFFLKMGGWLSRYPRDHFVRQKITFFLFLRTREMFFSSFLPFSRQPMIGFEKRDHHSRAPVLGYRMVVFLQRSIGRWPGYSRKRFAFGNRKNFEPAIFDFRENRDFSRSRDSIGAKTPPRKMVSFGLSAGGVSCRSDVCSFISEKKKSVTENRRFY